MKATPAVENIRLRPTVFRAPPCQRDVALERRVDGQVWAVRGEEERPVWVRRCFPWSEPSKFVSLRDEDENEFALIVEPEDLDVQSRGVLEDALAEAGFLLEITRVVAIDEEIEIRTWKVETRQGLRSFQTRLDEWPRPVPGGGILIRDLAGDLYYIGRPDALDARSRDLLWAFAD